MQLSLVILTFLNVQSLWTAYIALFSVMILAFTRLRYVKFFISINRRKFDGNIFVNELIWGVVMLPTFYAAYSFIKHLMSTNSNHYAMIVAAFLGVMFLWCSLEALKRIKL
jgi:hypothetical protein